MKKLSFLMAFFSLIFMKTTFAADITLYYSPYCPHCHHAQDFFSNEMIYEYPHLRIIQVNVMEENNLPVFKNALSKCKYDNGGVPVIVVGDKCFQGYAEFMKKELRDAVEKDMSEDDKRIVAENKKALEKDSVAFKKKHEQRKNAISEYVPKDEIDKTEKKNDMNSAIYLYVLLVALIAVLGFVLLRKDKKK